MEIFNDDLSEKTYGIIDYKINYHLKDGSSTEKFYNTNRKLMMSKSRILKKYLIDIKNADRKILENDILYSLSNASRADIKRLLGYEYGISLKNISENIYPSYTESILNIWNSPVKGRNRLLDGNKFFIFTSLYWKIISGEFRDSSIIILNIPITENERPIKLKSIAKGGITDRLIIENNNTKNSKSIAVISTYTFLNSNIDKASVKKIFSYYIIQTIAMMFAKYDTDINEKHSIMAEVNGFDYFNWYSNIINFQLKEPYKTIKKYDDSLY